MLDKIYREDVQSKKIFILFRLLGSMVLVFCGCSAIQRMQTEVEKSIQTIHCNTQAVYNNYLTVERSTASICENQNAIAQTSEAISKNIDAVEKSSEIILANNKEVEKSLALLVENEERLKKSCQAIGQSTESVSKLTQIMEPLQKAPYFVGALLLIILGSLVVPSLIFLYGIHKLKK